MNFDASTSFGYPVFRTLVSGENPADLDYPNKTFEPVLTIKRSASNPDTILVSIKEGENSLTVRELQELVDSGVAQLQLSVECAKTFYDEIFPLEPGVDVELDANQLSGTVDYIVFLTVKQKFSFSPVDAHSDFKGITFEPEPGQVLAYCQPLSRTVDKDQYKSVKAIFELALDPTVEVGEFRLITSEEYVIIQLHPKTHDKVHIGQANVKRRLLLVTSFFIPIMMQLLYILKESPEARYDQRWGQVIMQKLTDMRLDIEDENLIPNYAQRLWNMPFQELADNDFGA